MKKKYLIIAAFIVTLGVTAAGCYEGREIERPRYEHREHRHHDRDRYDRDYHRDRDRD